MARPVVGIYADVAPMSWAPWVDRPSVVAPAALGDAVQRAGGMAVLLAPDPGLQRPELLELLDALIAFDGAEGAEVVLGAARERGLAALRARRRAAHAGRDGRGLRARRRRPARAVKRPMPRPEGWRGIGWAEEPGTSVHGGRADQVREAMRSCTRVEAFVAAVLPPCTAFSTRAVTSSTFLATGSRSLATMRASLPNRSRP